MTSLARLGTAKPPERQLNKRHTGSTAGRTADALPAKRDMTESDTIDAHKHNVEQDLLESFLCSHPTKT